MLRRLLFLALFALSIPARGAPVSLEFDHAFGRRIAKEPGATNYPSGIAYDEQRGFIYVMDLLFNRIQKFDEDGNFQAQWPCRQGLGLAVDPRTGSVWAAMWTTNQVIRYSPTGEVELTLGTKKRGTEPGQFDRPHDVSVDPRSGDLYVMDTYNKRVQVFKADGTFLRQWKANFIQPFGIAVHPKGEFVVVANTANRELLKFDLQGKLLDSWKRPGSKPGEFRWPRNVAVDERGHIFEADTDNERVQELDADGNFVAFIQGPNDRERYSFHPRSLDVGPSGHRVFVTASYANRVDRFDDGEFVASVTSRRREGPRFNTPKGIAVSPKSGDVYVGDWMDHRIRRFTRAGDFVDAYDAWIPEQTDMQGNPFPAGYAEDPATGMWIAKEDQAFPAPIAFDDESDYWMIRGSMHYDDDPRLQADWLVRRFSADGSFIQGFGNADFPRNARMRGIAVDRAARQVYVSNTEANLLMKFDFDGKLLWKVGADVLEDPAGLAWDPRDQRLYVVDSGHQQVRVFDGQGQLQRSFGEEGRGEGQLRTNEFSGVAVDPRGYVYVADSKNDRVQVFDSAGDFVMAMGEHGFGGHGRFAGVSAVAWDDDLLYVIDTAGGQIEAWRVLYGDDAAAPTAVAPASQAPAPPEAPVDTTEAPTSELDALRARVDELESELKACKKKRRR